MLNSAPTPRGAHERQAGESPLARLFVEHNQELLSFLVALYLTVSRGGMGSLGIGMVLLFVLGTGRLQMLANLLLVALPGAWLWWRMQNMPGLLETGIPPQGRPSGTP